MNEQQFNAHLALHGLVRYDPKVGVNVGAPTLMYVDDEHLIDMFRMRAFIRIDQYGDIGLDRAKERAIPGFEEFGCCGMVAFYTLKK